MASVVKHESGWRAFISLDGVRKTKTFKSKADALFWAKTVEKSFQRDGFIETKIPFAQLLEEYAQKASITKRGASEELRRIRALQKDKKLAELPISAITKVILQDWVDSKIGSVSDFTGRKIKSSSVARYLCIIKAVFAKAVDWRYLAASPAAGVVCKVVEDHRERVATNEEIEMLKAAALWDEHEPPMLQSQRIIAAFVFACFTGMRIGEIVQMERSWINGNVITIPREITKTYHGRSVAVPNRAKNVLDQVLKVGLEPKIFGLAPKQHDALFRKIRNAAGLGAVYDSDGHEIKESLNFHDSRATFCTWAASPGADGAPRLDVLALARQTGHRNIKMLMKYYRKDASELLERLNG